MRYKVKKNETVNKNKTSNNLNYYGQKKIITFESHTTQLCSEKKGAHSTTYFALFLHKYFEVLVDDGYCKQDTCARPNGPHKVSNNGEGPDAETTECRGRWDVPVEFVNHGLLTMTSHDHLLFLEMLGNILGRRPGNIDPSFGEEGTRAEHEGNVDESMARILQDMAETLGWRHVVAQASNGIGGPSWPTCTLVSPHTQEVDEEVALEFHS